VEAERLQTGRETDEDRRRHSQLTAEAEELEALAASLEEQYQILQEQRARLEVRSPIEGEVLTWDLKKRLEARPVTRGQILTTVADLDGPWRLELRVPDRRIGHVLAAQAEVGERLAVSFVLATDPSRRFRGEVRELGTRAEVDESGEAFVLATVDIDRDRVPNLVPGATVVSKIQCGRRPIGYVWLHDVIDAVRLWILF
jgi:multidrug efflux pump subunit AcrA (membrane-fusion protein)